MSFSYIDRIDDVAVEGRYYQLLNLIAGASLVLAFAPFGYWYLIFPGLIWFILPLQSLSVKHAFFRSLSFNIGLYGAGVSWVHISIYQFSTTPWLLSLTFTALFVVFLSLLASISIVLLNRFCAGFSSYMYFLVAFPFFWLCSEWMFNWIFTGFPWLSLGYSQIDSYLSSLAPLLGNSAISFLIVLIAGLISVILRKGIINSKFAVIVMILITISVTYLQQIQWLTLTGKSLSVSLIQPNISQHKKWLYEQRKATLEYFYQTTKELDSQLVIWPEGAVPALAHRVENYLSLVDSIAWNNNQAVLTGIAVKEENKYYNAALMLGNGKGKYYKQHLVLFGEFVPMESLIRGLTGFFDLPMSSFNKGSEGQPLLQANQWKIAMVLCYEIIFQDILDNQLQDAELLVNLSNDAWFGDSIGPYQHLAIARMRALENGIPVIRSTNDGISALIDHQGKIIDRLGKLEQGILSGTITAVSGVTPYRQLGPALSYLIILLILGLIITILLFLKHRGHVEKNG